MDIGPVESRPYMPGHPDDVTALLRAWGEGDEQALHQLMPLVERELNRVARACLAGDRGGLGERRSGAFLSRTTG